MRAYLISECLSYAPLIVRFGSIIYTYGEHGPNHLRQGMMG